MKLFDGLKKGAAFVQHHADTTLTVTAMVGLGATVANAVDDTLEAERRRQELPPGATRREEFKAVAPCYIPTAISTLLTGGCIIGSHKVSVRKQAAAMALYSASELTLRQYQDKVRSMFGDEKADEIDREVQLERARAHSISEKTYRQADEIEIYETGHGRDLFYDVFSDRWFYSSAEFVKNGIIDIKREVMSSYDNCATLNDLYAKWGLRPIGGGNTAIFTLDHLPDIPERFTRAEVSPNGHPALEIEFLPGHYPVDMKTGRELRI